MRVLATIALSAALMFAAPVFGGFDIATTGASTRTMPLNETVISKTAPDGTWPFALKADDREPVRYYSI